MYIKVRSEEATGAAKVYFTEHPMSAASAVSYGVLVGATMPASDGRARVWHERAGGKWIVAETWDAIRFEGMPFTD